MFSVDMSIDNHPPGLVIRGVSPWPLQEVTSVTKSSTHSEVQIREYVREFEFLIAPGRNWTCKMGFEQPGNDDSWCACLGKQCHLWLFWLQPR